MQLNLVHYLTIYQYLKLKDKEPKF